MWKERGTFARHPGLLTVLHLFSRRDKQKERSRQEKLKVYQETGVWPGFKSKAAGKSEAWSNNVDHKGRKDERRMVKELKRKRIEREEKKEEDENDAEDDELEEDYKLLKKMKKGKKVRI
jgi:hypothetical protein